MKHIVNWVFVLCAVLGLTGCTDALNFNSTNVTGSSLGQHWSLPDHHGQRVELSDYQGKVIVMAFGFTQCPDVCPTTLQLLSDMMVGLGEQADQVQVLFVSIDPERDTADILSEYVTQFDPRFIGLTGSLEETKQIAKAFNVHYAKVFSKTEGSYTMEHSTGMYVFDKTGAIRLFVSMNQTPEALVQDIKQLL